MLWTIFVILLVLWGLGLLTGTTMGGVIHALLEAVDKLKKASFRERCIIG